MEKLTAFKDFDSKFEFQSFWIKKLSQMKNWGLQTLQLVQNESYNMKAFHWKGLSEPFSHMLSDSEMILEESWGMIHSEWRISVNEIFN